MSVNASAIHQLQNRASELSLGAISEFKVDVDQADPATIYIGFMASFKGCGYSLSRN